MKVVLIGYRGTGKSTVGKLLAERLGWDMVSTDAEIVRKAGCSIPDIVARHGWEYFRDLESAACQALAQRDSIVVDTGGGVILRDHNISQLKSNARVFWLTAPVSTIAERIGGDTQRPSLTGSKSFVEEIEEVLEERAPKYQAAADHVISTDNHSPAQLVEQIIHCLKHAQQVKEPQQ